MDDLSETQRSPMCHEMGHSINLSHQPLIETENLMLEFDLSECVDRNQEIDPETEVVLPGDFLRNGMRTLSTFDQRFYHAGSGPMSDHTARMIRIRNRWCTVTHLSFYDDELVFIGVYDDGIQEQRLLNRKCAWVVKRDSIRPSLFRRVIAWCRTH